jgi:hypothetical protein
MVRVISRSPAGRVECMTVAFCGGVVGLLWFWLLDIHPRFIGAVIGASSAGLSGFVMFWAWRERVTIARIEALQQVREPYPWELHDLQPMPDRSTWEATSPTSWAKLDLARACGDVYAADEFTRLVKQNHRLQVEYWKTVRRVGRVKFEHMRAALEAVGYVDRGGAKGSYRWTEDGERWLNGL